VTLMHRDPLSRLTFRQWLAYRSEYRSLVVEAGRAREPLGRDARWKLKAAARAKARSTR